MGVLFLVLGLGSNRGSFFEGGERGVRFWGGVSRALFWTAGVNTLWERVQVGAGDGDGIGSDGATRHLLCRVMESIPSGGHGGGYSSRSGVGPFGEHLGRLHLADLKDHCCNFCDERSESRWCAVSRYDAR